MGQLMSDEEIEWILLNRAIEPMISIVLDNSAINAFRTEGRSPADRMSIGRVAIELLRRGHLRPYENGDMENLIMAINTLGGIERLCFSITPAGMVRRSEIESKCVIKSKWRPRRAGLVRAARRAASWLILGSVAMAGEALLGPMKALIDWVKSLI